MFTGIIEHLGKIISLSPRAGGQAITIDIGPLADGSRLGDSIAVNGVCLTITEFSGSIARFDVSPETIAKSTLKSIRPGLLVNLERAMQAGGRFGGHIVQGHIDGVGKIISIQKKGAFAEFVIEPPKELLTEIIAKGSIALDGISLTVAGIENGRFWIAIIPETLVRTTWSQAKIGDAVNIETDIIVKSVRKQLERILPATGNLTLEKLRDLGF